MRVVFMVMTERGLKRVSTACSLMARGKQIGTFFRQHNGSCIGIAANDGQYRGQSRTDSTPTT